MEVHQILAGNKFIRVANIEHLLLYFISLLEVLFVEVRGHFAPDFNALDSGEVPLVLQVLPIRFIQLGPDQEIDVVNKIVFADESRSQAEFAVGLDGADDPSEHLGRHDLHLIQNDQAPIYLFNFIHSVLFLFSSCFAVADHRVGCDYDPCFVRLKHFVLRLRRESDRRSCEVCPVHELLAPLLHGNI